MNPKFRITVRPSDAFDSEAVFVRLERKGLLFWHRVESRVALSGRPDEVQSAKEQLQSVADRIRAKEAEFGRFEV